MYNKYQYMFYQYVNLLPFEGDVTEKNMSFFFLKEKFEGKHF